MAIFMLIVGIAVTMFNYVSAQVRDNQEEDFMNTVASSSSEMLLRTEGSPRNWTQDGVRSIGLASNGLMNKSKVVGFVTMDYGESRSAMKIKPYEMLVTFRGINGSLLVMDGTVLAAGTEPPGSAQVSRSQRSGIIADGDVRTVAIMEVVLWREKTI